MLLLAGLFVLVVALLSKVLIFSRWIGTLEQTIDIIRHNSKRCSSCVKLKNIIFHDVIAENGPFFFEVLFDDSDLNQHRFPQTN